MKNKFLVITSIALATVFLTGCFTESNAAITVGNNMNSSLNQLSSTVRKLDSIENTYISNPDVIVAKSSELNSIPHSDREAKTTIIAENNDSLNNLLKDEILNRLVCDDNGNCILCDSKFVCDDDNICNNCNTTVNFDTSGNCKYCRQTLNLNGNNCSNCNRNVVSGRRNSSINKSMSSILQQISNNNKSITSTDVELLSTKKLNPEPIKVLDNIATDETNNTTADTVNTQSSNENNNNTTNQNTSADNDSLSIIYYSEEMFLPEYLRYNPRYISSYDVELANNHIARYMDKVQKLYAISTDVLEANNTLSDYKITVLSNINDAKELNNCIINGTCTPSEQQIAALNNYISDLKTTIKNLKNCNGQLNNEINKISKSNTLTNSIDIINSNYVKILNHIDTRISYHENALATLEQIKYLITDAIENNNADNAIIDNNTHNDDNNNVIIDNNDSVNEYENNNSNTNTDTNSNTNLDNNTIIDNTDNDDTLDDVNLDTNTTTDNDNLTNNDDIVENEVENTENDNQIMVSYITNNTNLYIRVTTGVNSIDYDNQESLTLYKSKKIDFCIMDKKVAFQATGLYEENKYAVKFNDYNELVKILDGFKEIEK